MCLGPGVVVNQITGTCMCETDLTQYNATALGCVCLPETGLIFNDDLSGCICEEDALFEYSEDEGTCVSRPVAAIIEELDVYQMCVGQFFVESLELEEECQTTVFSGLFNADFSVFGTDFGPGRLGDFLAGANLDFGDCADVSVILESEAFFSIDVLIGIIRVFELEGVDITDADFMTDLDVLITVDFWATTAATFSLEIFTDFVATLEVEIEITLIVETLQAAGEFVACFGPGAVINAEGVCECSIANMVLDTALGTCGCAVDVDGVAAGFVFNEDLQECICEADFSIIDEAAGVCVAMTAVQVKSELDVFQMCVGNFFLAQLEVVGVTLEADIEVQFFQLLFTLDFSVIGVGGFVDVFTDDFKASITALGVTELDINIFIASDTFYSITRLIDMLFIFQAAGVDITTTQFMDDLDVLITAEFWAFTEVTFTFDFMLEFFVSIEITLTKVNIPNLIPGRKYFFTFFSPHMLHV